MAILPKILGGVILKNDNPKNWIPPKVSESWFSIKKERKHNLSNSNDLLKFAA